MIRFILKRRSYDGHIDLRQEALYTIDCDVPALEGTLRNGGHGPYGFTIHELVGVELLDAAKGGSDAQD
jgi:hypothetical protein